MTDERYSVLMGDEASELTTAEIDEGWHFCASFDGLLVGPGMDMELYCCECEWPGILAELKKTIVFPSGPFMAEVIDL